MLDVTDITQGHNYMSHEADTMEDRLKRIGISTRLESMVTMSVWLGYSNVA